MAQMKTLSLIKRNNRFIFRFEAGQETLVLQAMIEMVGRPGLDFDWFDAAVLCHQLNEHLVKELKIHLPKKESGHGR